MTVHFLVGIKLTIAVFLFSTNLLSENLSPDVPMEHRSRYEAMLKKFGQCCSTLTEHTINVDELRALMKSEKKIVFVDYRELEEFRVSHLPNAIHHRAFKPASIAEDTTVIAYCTIGYRSGKATKKLRKRGVVAFNLIGGIYNWTYHNGTIFNDLEKPTNAVHVYSDDWNYLRSDYDVRK